MLHNICTPVPDWVKALYVEWTVAPREAWINVLIQESFLDESGYDVMYSYTLPDGSLGWVNGFLGI